MNREIDFSSYLYSRLPEVYRREDCRSDVNYALKRYLDSISEGGINTLFSDVLNLYDCLDIEKTPEDILPLWSKLFGYDYIHEVEPNVQRKILQNLIELYRRKGTKSVIEFITREFTSFDTEVIEMQYRVFKTWSPKPKNIPKDAYVEPKTLSSKGVENDTCYLLSSLKGMCNEQGIIIVVDAQSNQLGLLNRLLLEFMPIYCNIYLRVRSVFNTYEEELYLDTTEKDGSIKMSEQDTWKANNTDSGIDYVHMPVDTELVSTSGATSDSVFKVIQPVIEEQVDVAYDDNSLERIIDDVHSEEVDEVLFTTENTDTETEVTPPTEPPTEPSEP